MVRGAVLLAILQSTAASADDYPPPPPLPAPSASPVTDPDGPKNPWVAGLLSLFATAAPPAAVALFVGDPDHDGQYKYLEEVLITSALIGPSIGHLYAGKLLTVGLGVRAVGLLLGLAAFKENNTGDQAPYLFAGSACMIGGAIYDIATAGRSAREYNFEHAKRLMPTIAPVVGPNGTTQLRVGLAGSF